MTQKRWSVFFACSSLILAVCLMIAGCAPTSDSGKVSEQGNSPASKKASTQKSVESEKIETKSVEQKNVEQKYVEQKNVEPVSVKLDDVSALGVKIGWNADKTVKSLDLTTGFPEGGYFEADPRLMKVRVIRGKGLISDKLAAQMAKMESLTELLWTDAVLTENVFSVMTNGAKLKKIRLTGLKAPNFAEVLKSLEKLPALEDLDLSGSDLKDTDLAMSGGLSCASHLNQVNFYATGLTDAGVKQLLPLADRLTKLNLDATKITDGCSADLEKFGKLTFLHLGRSEVSDKIIPSLAKLKALKTVHVTRTKITEKGADDLRKALPETEVISVVQENKK